MANLKIYEIAEKEILAEIEKAERIDFSEEIDRQVEEYRREITEKMNSTKNEAIKERKLELRILREHKERIQRIEQEEAMKQQEQEVGEDDE